VSDAAREVAQVPGRPLVIGYGNSLRRDDGIGWHVARRLDADPRASGIDVIAARQLTPELAYDLHRATRVVLVDAAVGSSADAASATVGECVVGDCVVGDCVVGECVVGELDEGQETAGPSSHHCTPLALAALARALYGSVAPITTVGVGICSLDQGESLTPRVAQGLPRIVDLVLDLALNRPKESEHA
jgi:hydrogenase maturation protease